MAKVKVKINPQGMQAILNNAKVEALVDREAKRIASAAQSQYKGPASTDAHVQGYTASDVQHGRYGRRYGGRPVAYVNARGYHGNRDEARNKTLERILLAGKGG
ncbi:hypothetical protein EMO89_01670 [Bifidobacterium tissieri]|uniref:Uncharacterized protein n=1 Tax=Bifidobacterium tissieri TaxID=1630162 RepID=A0A5M9ZVG4_9BIFI|nr:hypothetical protein [Bifidobacterium tissieri]KAA8831469.1 hypothetical protein EMO89_01670 [Bifidobacterium tissieri]